MLFHSCSHVFPFRIYMWKYLHIVALICTSPKKTVDHFFRIEITKGAHLSTFSLGEKGLLNTYIYDAWPNRHG